ncbi:cold-inducible protein YdjO-related protein [Ectobacillus sp. sgz5001026]|uniref:cold-inducible protein YdjO-related protein n=1 Tax=Ectobacillus sp. sgz5001026 TaxID=3242473 RepID=UPI0036D37569
MNWNKKKDIMQQERKLEEVEVWACEADDCKGWMRKEFSLSEVPTCPLCKSKMKTETRMLYELSN